jgi:hypothetical protein
MSMQHDAGARCFRRGGGLYACAAGRAKRAKEAELGASQLAGAKAELEQRSAVLARELSDFKVKQAELSKAQVELRKNQAAAMDMYVTGLRKCLQGDARRCAGAVPVPS